MPYIIAEPCVDVKDKSCVEACPVDCIYDVGNQLMINPEECIDCGACVDPCPVEAIHHEDELPDKWNSFIDKAKSTDFDSLSPAERNG
ncbi:4Fe-4S binding protein [bacterium]|jgi:NAD-dependent dihydropyrimidine dehydrogenase PreA subunit|nr:4Fe-4S binding protein [bacterium]MDG2446105.1 ferredoxin family protein [Thermodesulfobacteriota bacterium]RZP12895.1 MAG: ferredoxin [Candidatus Dadabacteria bacterium]MBT3850121.1 4Fe-4S binding protein [bacterium]MBT4435033.1 4Fe-4S binding protein [bacterium]|tara:strand:- start:21 stop:284 length:264 start_codon:yes stop_codon:yes gene_type:complete